jgi:cyclopropane fatty-acyl-phospholipid synthase-like methyltransferase
MQSRLIPIIKKIPVLNTLGRSVYRLFVKNQVAFPGSAAYWESRYKSGGNSGAGSYNRLAEFKATVLNEFVTDNQIKTVAEFGCGDGNQLSLCAYPKYIGLDVAKSAIDICKAKFKQDPSKSFYHLDGTGLPKGGSLFPVDLALSLDVIYHLIEDEVFERYMRELFSASSKYVIIYASDFATQQVFHEKDRVFTKWIEKSIPGWHLNAKIKNAYPYDPNDQENTSKADFFVYKKSG